MQVYNCNETGISIVHKPGKVVAELGCRHIYALTFAECGKTVRLYYATYDGVPM